MLAYSINMHHLLRSRHMMPVACSKKGGAVAYRFDVALRGAVRAAFLFIEAASLKRAVSEGSGSRVEDYLDT